MVSATASLVLQDPFELLVHRVRATFHDQLDQDRSSKAEIFSLSSARM
jgi:hypothetical protein